MNMKGTVTISLDDFDIMRKEVDNMRKEYENLLTKIKSTYTIDNTQYTKYLSFDINEFLSIIEDLEFKSSYKKFQRQKDNIIKIGEDTNYELENIDDDDIPF